MQINCHGDKNIYMFVFVWVLKTGAKQSGIEYETELKN